jgi:hypothetical protein
MTVLVGENGLFFNSMEAGRSSYKLVCDDSIIRLLSTFPSTFLAPRRQMTDKLFQNGMRIGMLAMLSLTVFALLWTGDLPSHQFRGPGEFRSVPRLAVSAAFSRKFVCKRGNSQLTSIPLFGHGLECRWSMIGRRSSDIADVR